MARLRIADDDSGPQRGPIHLAEPPNGRSLIGRSRCGSEAGRDGVQRPRALDAPGAPAAIGPYSHAVRAGGCCSAPGRYRWTRSGEIIGASAAEQAERCLRNLQAVCEAAGTRLAQAVRMTVYMTDLGAFAEVNEVYARSSHRAAPPARVAICVAALPRGSAGRVDATVARTDDAVSPGSAQQRSLDSCRSRSSATRSRNRSLRGTCTGPVSRLTCSCSSARQPRRLPHASVAEHDDGADDRAAPVVRHSDCGRLGHGLHGGATSADSTSRTA